MIQSLEALPKDIGPNDRVIELKPFQDGFIFTEARYPALVSAWGTGKTMSLIEKVRLACEEYPSNLILVLRKEFVDLRDSTIKDWNDNTGIIVNSTRDAVFPNGSIVMFRHAEELRGNNLNNINLGGFAIEQGEELESDEVFFKLQGRLRRKGVRHFGAVIANTCGHNWIYKLWKAPNGSDPDYPLFEATSFDNSDVLPEKTVEDWRKLKDRKPKIFNRFVMNSWDEADLVDVIIQPTWVQQAANRILNIRAPFYRVVSIDVARGGSDVSVFYAIENCKSLGHESYNTRNTMELVGRAQVFAKKHGGIKCYAVDEIGVGAGVADRLKELGHEVIFINASERENVPAPFFNRRSQIIGEVAQLFEEGNIQIENNDQDLIEQLSWTKWKPIKSTMELQAESKDAVRETYGRSPDNADSFINGIWALSKIATVHRNQSISVGGWNGKSYVPPPPGSYRGGFKELIPS